VLVRLPHPLNIHPRRDKDVAATLGSSIMETRIQIATSLSILLFMYLMIGPIFFDFVGDIYLHVELLFKVSPAIFITLFFGTIAEEIAGYR